MILRTGVLVTVWPDGRVKITSTTGNIGEIEEAELVVIQMGAVWEDDSLPAVQQLRVVFGTLGVRAKTRASAAGFQ